MDVYIIDANLIFSSALNIKSGIGQFILKSRERNISLYAPKYLEREIKIHFPRIAGISGLKEEEV